MSVSPYYLDYDSKKKILEAIPMNLLFSFCASKNLLIFTNSKEELIKRMLNRTWTLEEIKELVEYHQEIKARPTLAVSLFKMLPKEKSPLYMTGLMNNIENANIEIDKFEDPNQIKFYLTYEHADAVTDEMGIPRVFKYPKIYEIMIHWSYKILTVSSARPKMLKKIIKDLKDILNVRLEHMSIYKLDVDKTTRNTILPNFVKKLNDFTDFSVDHLISVYFDLEERVKEIKPKEGKTRIIFEGEMLFDDPDIRDYIAKGYLIQGIKFSMKWLDDIKVDIYLRSYRSRTSITALYFPKDEKRAAGLDLIEYLSTLFVEYIGQFQKQEEPKLTEWFENPG